MGVGACGREHGGGCMHVGRCMLGREHGGGVHVRQVLRKVPSCENSNCMHSVDKVANYFDNMQLFDESMVMKVHYICMLMMIKHVRG